MALVDPACTAGLTRNQVLEGALEALFRAAGPYVGDHVDRPEQDGAALALVRAIASWVGRLGSTAAPASAHGRLALALLSQRTQKPALVPGRPLFATKWWFVANNVSHALGVPKMTGLLWVLPRVWARLPSLPALGSVRHRDQVWAALREQTAVRLPEEPAAGLEALVRWLGVPTLPGIPRPVAEDVARSCTRMWGGGLPMLAGLPSAQLADLLTDDPPATRQPALLTDPTPRQTAAVATHPHK